MNVPLDILLRAAGAATGLVFLLVVATSSEWRRRGDLIALIACAVAYLVCSAPARPCCTSPWTVPLLMGAASFPFAFWRLARVVLEDETSVSPLAWVGFALLLTSALVAAPDYFQTPPAGGPRRPPSTSWPRSGSSAQHFTLPGAVGRATCSSRGGGCAGG